MKNVKLIGLVAITCILNTACTSVSGNMTADSNQVTIRHGTLASMSDVQAEANQYCANYGKSAYFRSNYNQNNAVFECK